MLIVEKMADHEAADSLYNLAPWKTNISFMLSLTQMKFLCTRCQHGKRGFSSFFFKLLETEKRCKTWLIRPLNIL